jgi:raffinose/stachyose/melibiose transport system permease protein
MRMQLRYVSSATVRYLSLLLASFVAVFPILVVFFASFKTPYEYVNGNALALPDRFTYLTNYSRAFLEGDMLLGFANTAILMAASLAGAIILSSMVAYVLSRFRFRGRKLIILGFLFATLVPGVTTQVATFRIINGLGLLNTRMAAIILYMGTDIVSIYIMLQFLDGFSVSLDESAMLDGASYFTIWRRIILPLLSPAIATVIIIKGVGIYNDFYAPFLYMPRMDLLTVSTSLFRFKGPYGSEWQVICAGIVIATVPTLICFLALQKHIYNGFTQGSVK